MCKLNLTTFINYLTGCLPYLSRNTTIKYLDTEIRIKLLLLLNNNYVQNTREYLW